MLSVPVRLADQPVGTLNVYATQPRAWTPGEVEALGALAVVTAELVSTAVELANREVEVAQLRQALASRVWIEQAKGVLAATQGVSPDAAFQQLRRQARSSSRKVADLAQHGAGSPGDAWPSWPAAARSQGLLCGWRPGVSTIPVSSILRRGDRCYLLVRIQDRPAQRAPPGR